MIQKFKQIRYFNDNSDKNNPTNLTQEDLISGICFDKYLPANQIGISALPGTKFYLNGGISPVIINFSGLFELNLSNEGTISSLHFDEKSLAYIKENDSAYLLVDLVYLGNGG